MCAGCSKPGATACHQAPQLLGRALYLKDLRVLISNAAIVFRLLSRPFFHPCAPRFVINRPLARPPNAPGGFAQQTCLHIADSQQRAMKRAHKHARSARPRSHAREVCAPVWPHSPCRARAHIRWTRHLETAASVSALPQICARSLALLSASALRLRRFREASPRAAPPREAPSRAASLDRCACARHATLTRRHATRAHLPWRPSLGALEARVVCPWRRAPRKERRRAHRLRWTPFWVRRYARYCYVLRHGTGYHLHTDSGSPYLTTHLRLMAIHRA